MVCFPLERTLADFSKIEYKFYFYNTLEYLFCFFCAFPRDQGRFGGQVLNQQVRIFVLKIECGSCSVVGEESGRAGSNKIIRLIK